MHGASWRRTTARLHGLIAALIVTGATLAIPAASAAAATKPFVVCNQYGGQAGPDISGPVVVWTDNRNGNLDIYGRRLGSAAHVAICTHKAQQDNPSVTRSVTATGKTRYLVVWVDRRNHRSGPATDIYGRDITLRRDFVVARSTSIKWFPEIVDHWVIWIEADDSAGPYRIKVRDIESARTYLLATSSVLSSVGIDSRTIGSRTVYTAVYTSGKGNISGRDIPRGDPFNVSQRGTFEWMPDISHHRVVWWETGGRIMLKDLRTGRRTFIHSGSRPRIDGTLVTWDGGGHGGEFVVSYRRDARIYVRDVVRDSGTLVIRQRDLTCLFPAISGQRVVWESGPAERVLAHIHIYGARLR